MKPSIVLNTSLRGLRCLRCNRNYSQYYDCSDGCRYCLAEGFPVNLKVLYGNDNDWKVVSGKNGMQRYSKMLPFQRFSTLGEGNTPIISSVKLAQHLQVKKVWIKNEGHNPTGSHKDRMSALSVTKAIYSGFNTVITSSTGNAAVSLAAYANLNDIHCCIVTTGEISSQWLQALIALNAEIHFCEYHERWEIIRKLTTVRNMFSVSNTLSPPIGGNPYGVQGYKTISYEVVEQCIEQQPNIIVVPASLGDLLWGVWMGFCDAYRLGKIKSLPRMIAAEPLPRISNALEGIDYRKGLIESKTKQSSLSGPNTTFQALKAIKDSNGTSVTVADTEVIAAKSELAKLGLYVEISSASVMAALTKLKNDGYLTGEDTPLLILTSHGYK